MGAAAYQEGLIYFLYWLQYKTLAPVGERVLVKVDVSEEKSVGGILLPSSAQKKPTQGEVEKAGTAKAVKVPLLGKSRHIRCCTFPFMLSATATAPVRPS